MPSGGEIVVTFNLLPGMSAAMEERVQEALNAGADLLAADVRRSIETDYPPASDPGEPPHRRTGDLQASIEAVHDAGPLEADVTAGTDYATVLEYGGAYLAARPFMTPAAQQDTEIIIEKLQSAIERLAQ